MANNERRERALANPNQDHDAVFEELERYLRTQGFKNARVTVATETEDWEAQFNPPKLWHKVVFTADDSGD